MVFTSSFRPAMGRRILPFAHDMRFQSSSCYFPPSIRDGEHHLPNGQTATESDTYVTDARRRYQPHSLPPGCNRLCVACSPSIKHMQKHIFKLSFHWFSWYRWTEWDAHRPFFMKRAYFEPTASRLQSERSSADLSAHHMFFSPLWRFMGK